MTLVPQEDGVIPDLNEFISELLLNPEREPIASELGGARIPFGLGVGSMTVLILLKYSSRSMEMNPSNYGHLMGIRHLAFGTKLL